MPHYKNLQDAADAAKKRRSAKPKSQDSSGKGIIKVDPRESNGGFNKPVYRVQPITPKPAGPKLGAMPKAPKAPKSSYPKSSSSAGKTLPAKPKMGRPLPAAGSGRKVILKKY